MQYIPGRENLACTLFVPSDCQCDCPFCNTKKLYADFKPDPKYIYDQCKTILALNHQRAIKEYVVYGDRCYVNDVILDMCGHIYRDWDMVPDSGFKEALANEKFE